MLLLSISINVHVTTPTATATNTISTIVPLGYYEYYSITTTNTTTSAITTTSTIVLLPPLLISASTTTSISILLLSMQHRSIAVVGPSSFQNRLPKANYDVSSIALLALSCRLSFPEVLGTILYDRGS